jgi:protein arginine kinase
MSQPTFQTLLKLSKGLAVGNSPPEPIVLSARVRLARNLADQPFPGWAKKEQRQAVLECCADALLHLTNLKQPSILHMETLSDLEKNVLVECHLISRELCKSTSGSAVVVNKDATFAVMINEEDHLRMQYLFGGLQLKKIWQKIDSLDTDLESNLNYAFSTELGYLTACPTNVGTAMRASAMLHLPGLVLSNQMEKVIRAVNQLGMTVRGLFGEGSDATGSIFQISNQQTLGESEEAILLKLSSVLQTVVEQEKNARTCLLEDESTKILDKLGRAYGVLKSAYILSSTEAMNTLSLMRLAIDLQMLPEENRALIDRLFTDIQPAHIQYALSVIDAKAAQDAQVRDRYRADILRGQFAQFPPLDASIIKIK